jgi:hypothetical protein
MKIQKSGKTVTIDREDLEILVKHVGEFEKLVGAFERLEAAGKLAPDFQRQWAATKKFLNAEESRIAGSAGGTSSKQATTRELRKKRCCKLLLGNDVVNCRETNTRYVFALALCVAEAIAGLYNAQLSAGSCAALSGCP